MSDDLRPDDPGRRSQTRLAELLGLLRAGPPEPPPELADQIVRSARYERGIRATARTAADLGTAVLDGLAILLGLRRPR
jgi:hypothetical protein